VAGKNGIMKRIGVLANSMIMIMIMIMMPVGPTVGK
jgi:hypothetical protein